MQQLLLVLLLSPLISSYPTIRTSPSFRNLRAHYDQASDAIVAEWSYDAANSSSSSSGSGSNTPREEQQPLIFVVRYRVANRGDPDAAWSVGRTREHKLRLNVPDIRNNDQLQVQVMAERGQSEEPEHWSQTLLITVTKRLYAGDRELDERQLAPPLDFRAHVLSPSTVKLEWTPPENERVAGEVNYVVNVKQLTSTDGAAVLAHQQIKTAATSFTLGRLAPGERYEMTVRSATAADQVVSDTAALVDIRMPRADEFFEIGNLVVASHFTSHTNGVVNVTWQVPPHMQGQVRGYSLHYSPVALSTPQWQEIVLDGSVASATLTQLTSDTEYLLRLRTTLVDNVLMETGQFRFRTPHVLPPLFRRIDVIYSHEVANVRLHWILESSVDRTQIAGYDVYISDDKDRAESAWRHVRLEGKDAELSLDDLKSATLYYVRVNVRNTDGSVLRAPSVYRFRTMDESSVRESNSLSHHNAGPGEGLINWTFPAVLDGRAVGASILYTEDGRMPLDRWRRLTVMNEKAVSVRLPGLSPGSTYQVHIVPLLRNGVYDVDHKDVFELHTNNELPNTVARDQDAPPEEDDAPVQFEPLKMNNEREHLSIVSCNPDAIKTGCAWDEQCVARLDAPESGWCISNELRNAILMS